LIIEMYKLGQQMDFATREMYAVFIPGLLSLATTFNDARREGLGLLQIMSMLGGKAFTSSADEVVRLNSAIADAEKRKGNFGDKVLSIFGVGAEQNIERMKGELRVLMKPFNAELDKMLADQEKGFQLRSTAMISDRPAPKGGRTRAPRAARAASKIDEGAKAAEAWLKKLQTPLQEYAAKVDEITMLHDKNKLSSADMQGALALAASEFDKAIKSTDEYRDAQAKLAEQQRAQEDLQREIASIYDDTRTPIERLNIELTRLNDLYATGALDLDTYARAQFALEDSLNSHAADAEKIVTVYDAMGNAVAGWSDQFADALLDANSSFEKFAASITKQLAKIAISAALQPFLRGFGDFISGGISGARATGGPVSAGSAYLVGERGPELFMPGANGKILPNAGGNSVTQNITINGAPNPAELAGWAERIRQSTLRALAVDQARGAGLARARA
jgi:hypothetical protein